MAVVLMAAGAKGVTVPDVDEARTQLDQLLGEERRPIKPQRDVLLEALGVRRAR